MRRISVFLLLFLLTVSAWAGEKWQLTILHTNDLHGWMMPFDYQKTNAQLMKSESVVDTYARNDAGGLARRATLIGKIRKTTKNSVVVIDAGDFFTRGPWHQTFFGAPEVEAMNMMGFDMMCVGNNEFKANGDTTSQQVMLGLMRQCRFPWLAANLTVGDTGVPVEGIHPYIVRRYGNVRVGFLGLTAPRSKDYPQTVGWTISDPIEVAKTWVPIARKECDILIAVTHIGVDLDKDLAAKVAGIDAIIGGDSHTFISAPIMVENPQGVKVPIAQAGAYGVMLGRLDLSFELTDAWHLKTTTGALIPIDNKIREDAVVKKALQQWLDRAKQPKKEAAAWRVPAELPLPACA